VGYIRAPVLAGRFRVDIAARTRARNVPMWLSASSLYLTVRNPGAATVADKTPGNGTRCRYLRRLEWPPSTTGSQDSTMISTASSVYTPRLDAVGRWLSPLALRTLLAWEFFESGREKLGGQNWFADLEGRFPFPFSTLPASLNWQLATWLELVGAVMLLLGLATRSVAYVFWVLTIVAIAAVHWPDQWNGLGELWQGYAITDQGYGNFKLPLLFLAMLLPLILNGGGALSVDRLLAGPGRATAGNDGLGWGVSLIALLLPVAALLPGIGFGGALLGGVLLLGHLLRCRRAA